MTQETTTPPVPCPKCQEDMRPLIARTTIWQEDRLFVVEDVPAQFCDRCMEQYYSDRTASAIKKLSEERFPKSKAVRKIVVPVFSLAESVPSTNGAGD
jgi:YgiT-type zinc finger domain-containing protein